jgi:hypothetical protein
MSLRPAILIVEEEQWRDTLGRLCRQSFPSVEIYGTCEADEVPGHLERGRSLGLSYIALVFEIDTLMRKEPPFGMDTARRDRVFAAQTWGLGEAPVLLFTSAHLDDPVVVEFRRAAAEAMASTVDVPRQVFLDKFAEAWDEQLIEQLKKMVHPRRIAAELAAMAPYLPPRMPAIEAAPGPEAWSPELSNPFIANPGHRIADLMRDIEKSWGYLRQDLQFEVRRYFDVRPRPPGVRLTLP